MAVHGFTICGVDLEVECEGPVPDGRVGSLLLQLFEMRRREPCADETAIVIRLRTCSQRWNTLGQTAGRQIFRSGLLNLFETACGYLVQCGSSLLRVQWAGSVADGCLDEDFWRLPLQVQRAFFFLPLLFLLPKYGLYGLHANGIVKDGVGFLVAGGSGRGKTTLALALLRRGWSYLSDDTILLRAFGDRIEALSFRRGFACTSHTLAQFPEFSSSQAEAAWKADKTLVNVDQIYPNRHVPQCDPGVILLPEITPAAHSSVQPLSPATALALLIQQSPGVLTQRECVENQMDVLRKLVATTRHWRVLLGTDVLEDPLSVSRLLWNASNPQ